ncbi:hypothetical protein C8J57DRAFT_571928 [Mycena rebaudengoi]|nr:hypothetical protein C8J57DRAFT_571928 [Mycena rebaudengoi]
MVASLTGADIVAGYKPGKLVVALLLQGRQAGKKVVLIKPPNEGTKEQPYRTHTPLLLASSSTRGMCPAHGGEKVMHRSKVINYSHLFPTRYTLELEGLEGTTTRQGKQVVLHVPQFLNTFTLRLVEYAVHINYCSLRLRVRVRRRHAHVPREYCA